MITTLRVALHPSVQASAREAKYALRVLLRLAGYAYEFVWSTAVEEADLYYGPTGWSGKAHCSVLFSGKSFVEAHALEPRGLHQQEGLDFLDFGEAQPGCHRTPEGRVCFTSDIVLAVFWLLSGARERHYPRDKRDNFHIADSFLVKSGLLERPAVSLYASFLRRHFTALGKQPAPLPWANGEGRAAFVFTHDVDYPEIIRSIEAVRVLAGLTHAPRNVIPGVLSGSKHFWKFSDWVELERRYGARPAFYFSARKGSLAEYALGTPDCFYDIHSPRFRDLFRYLRDEGCEIGLHASYNAFHSEAQLRHEKESLERASGSAVEGTRHHYWRLNPDAPHETLARHQRIGLRYDCSLGYEFFPGFRRGTCHPFRPFHPGERRELEILELPPTWMDDHFDRRLAKNRIADPAAPEVEIAERTTAHALRLLEAVRGTGGVAVLDYHVRGMNGDFFPRYGPWLARFAERHFDSSLRFASPKELARQYREYEQKSDAASRDSTEETPAPTAAHGDAEVEFNVGAMRSEEVPVVARLHFDFFGTGAMHGTSIANFGVEFLEEVFYRLNLDNPYLFVDVARYRGEIIAFSVYASDGKRVFRETLRRHFGGVAAALLKLGLRKPFMVLGHIFSNLQFLREQAPEAIRGIRAWDFLRGVKQEYRSREFKQRTGIWIADELWKHMEETLRKQGCDQFWTAVGAHNGPMNEMQRRWNMELVATGKVQGLPSNYYRKSLSLKSQT